MKTVFKYLPVVAVLFLGQNAFAVTKFCSKSYDSTSTTPYDCPLNGLSYSAWVNTKTNTHHEPDYNCENVCSKLAAAGVKTPGESNSPSTQTASTSNSGTNITINNGGVMSGALSTTAGASDPCSVTSEIYVNAARAVGSCGSSVSQTGTLVPTLQQGKSPGGTQTCPTALPLVQAYENQCGGFAAAGTMHQSAILMSKAIACGDGLLSNGAGGCVLDENTCIDGKAYQVQIENGTHSVATCHRKATAANTTPKDATLDKDGKPITTGATGASTGDKTSQNASGEPSDGSAVPVKGLQNFSSAEQLANVNSKTTTDHNAAAVATANTDLKNWNDLHPNGTNTDGTPLSDADKQQQKMLQNNVTLAQTQQASNVNAGKTDQYFLADAEVKNNAANAASNDLDNLKSTMNQNLADAKGNYSSAKSTKDVANQALADAKADPTYDQTALAKLQATSDQADKDFGTAQGAYTSAKTDYKNKDVTVSTTNDDGTTSKSKVNYTDQKNAYKTTQSKADDATAAANAKTGTSADKMMMDSGHSKARGCGQYGGASCQATDAFNSMSQTAETLGNNLGANSVTNTSNQQQMALQQKGMNATAADINKAQVQAAKTAAKAQGTMVDADTMVAAVQAYRLTQHLTSVKTVATTEKIQQANVDNTIKSSDQLGLALSTSAQQKYTAQLSQTDSMVRTQCQNCSEAVIQQQIQKNMQNSVGAQLKGNIAENAASEKGMQKQQAWTTAQSLASTMSSLMNHKMQQKAANTVAGITTPAMQNGLLFNPGANPGGPSDPTAPTETPTLGAVTSNNDGSGPGLDGSAPQFNPGDDSNPNDGPSPGAQLAGNTSGAGGAGPGMGGSGGTTAAKDDSAASTAQKATKNEAGGSYAATDSGPGATFSRKDSGGAGVGMDNGFADLLKKFLPGEEDAKKNDVAAASDRSPASDNAAVMGRNKNIFEEVHKRYDKKNREGAVVF